MLTAPLVRSFLLVTRNQITFDVMGLKRNFHHEEWKNCESEFGEKLALNCHLVKSTPNPLFHQLSKFVHLTNEVIKVRKTFQYPIFFVHQ